MSADVFNYILAIIIFAVGQLDGAELSYKCPELGVVCFATFGPDVLIRHVGHASLICSSISPNLKILTDERVKDDFFLEFIAANKMNNTKIIITGESISRREQRQTIDRKTKCLLPARYFLKDSTKYQCNDLKTEIAVVCQKATYDECKEACELTQYCEGFYIDGTSCIGYSNLSYDDDVDNETRKTRETEFVKLYRLDRLIEKTDSCFSDIKTTSPPSKEVYLNGNCIVS
ncbi:hypothetical protein HELRODRAFT_177349 [Helobdella robusta]|uniref:Apple domain-containing protein n=1 Tax=Helobdella robusta TaxID=6412 RepID=T1FBJ6_HELRO|nr:hypothetical protein HELRODRAFT_177349 [Helobdella robusta]ESN98111.1 hypothetical protein HELRODRAFT_177349 [Helobdella robusta]